MNNYIPNAHAWRDYYLRQAQNKSQYGGGALKDIKSHPIMTTQPPLNTVLTLKSPSLLNETNISQRIEADMKDLRRLTPRKANGGGIKRRHGGKRKSQKKNNGRSSRKVVRKPTKRKSRITKRKRRQGTKQSGGRKRQSSKRVRSDKGKALTIKRRRKTIF